MRSSVLLLVLGDLARSPRMLAHARSLSRMGYHVELAGFGGEELPADVAGDPRIRVRRVASFEWMRASGGAFLALAVAFCRQIALAMALTMTIARLQKPGLVLMQNPPAFPALPVVLLFAAKWRSRIVVDWHNLTGAMLRLRLGGRQAFVVRVVERLEMALGRRVHFHLAASEALAGALHQLDIRATTVLDRAPATFAPVERSRGSVPMIIAPTSWGADEDFSILLDAAVLCEQAGLALQFVVTGAGEGRAAFEQRLAAMTLRLVTIITKWVPPDDYPQTVASADLGLSLHRSASGVDIPMKIAEMLACGVPVCALDYGDAVREQLRVGEDSLLFSNASELASIFHSLFSNWPDAPKLDELQASIRKHDRPRWDDEWDRHVRPVIENVLT